MKTVMIFLLGCCFSLEGFAEMPQPLPAGSVLEAHFTQERYLSGIPKPLTSTGQIALWEGQGLLWTTQSPFPHALLITQKGVYQLENNTKSPIAKAGGNKALFDVLAGIFNITTETAVQGFTVEKLTPQDSLWRIRLIPQHPQVQNFIQSIQIEGDTYIRHITLLRPTGDRDEITLTDHCVKSEVPQGMRKLFHE
jgi:hypothetical protein